MPATLQQELSHYEEAQKRRTAVNRSGGACLAGGVYFVDTKQAQGESTTINLGLDNVSAVSTALIAQAPPVVVSLGTPADNARGQFIEGDGVRCKVLVLGTTDIAKGDPLKPVDGQAYLVKATKLTDSWCAIALEAFTTDGATTLIECLLYSSWRF